MFGKVGMEKFINMMCTRINEDFFDNLELSSDDIVSDVIEDNIPDSDTGFKYKLHIKICGIKPNQRSCSVFFLLLQKFDRLMKQGLDMSDLFSDYSSPIYTINESEMVDYRMHTIKYHSVSKIDNLLFTHSSGVRLFNDVDFVNDDELMNKYATDISIVINFDMIQKQSNAFNLIKFVSLFVNNVCYKTFGENKKNCKCKVFNMWIRKSDTTSTKRREYFSLGSAMLTNIINKKDDKFTRRAVNRLTMFITGNRTNRYSDKWFSKSTASPEVHDMLKAMNLNMRDVYVDEDDKSVRIEVPKDVKMKIVNPRYVSDVIKRSKKYYCFIINGKLCMTGWGGSILHMLNILDCVFPNVNQLELTMNGIKHSEAQVNKINLSLLYINDLKLIWKFSNYDRKYGLVCKTPIIYNPSSKPKKIKETERNT